MATALVARPPRQSIPGPATWNGLLHTWKSMSGRISVWISRGLVRTPVSGSHTLLTRTMSGTCIWDARDAWWLCPRFWRPGSLKRFLIISPFALYGLGLRDMPLFCFDCYQPFHSNDINTLFHVSFFSLSMLVQCFVVRMNGV